MTKWKQVLDLYFTFLKIGGLTIGGGYAMIPIIQREAVDKKKWVTEEEMIDYIAMAQSLPGVVGINTATAVGRKKYGSLGAIVATLGMVTPSLVIIMFIALFYDEFKKIIIINNAFIGVRAMVVALIVVAVVRMYKSAVVNRLHMVLAFTSFILIVFFKLSPPLALILCAVLSVVYHIGKEGK